jgi:hypothetical protein
MDLDKILVEMNDESANEVIKRNIDKGKKMASGETPFPADDEKGIKMSIAVSAGFLESFAGSLSDKVGKDLKTYLGGSVGKRMTVEEYINCLGDIIRKGSLTKMVSVSDMKNAGHFQPKGKPSPEEIEYGRLPSDDAFLSNKRIK